MLKFIPKIFGMFSWTFKLFASKKHIYSSLYHKAQNCALFSDPLDL